MSSKTIIDLVVEVIKRNPNAANSDPELYDRYWHEIDGWHDDKSLFWNLRRVTPPESITRARRKAHELGLIIYTDEADKAREERYKEELADNSNQAVSWLHGN